MISVVSFIKTYGYLAVFIGSIFEGESILLLGGLSAHEMYLSFPLVVFFAVLGAITGDWIFFFVGRYKREFLLKKLARLSTVTDKTQAYIEHRPRFFSFFMRFMYGFRHIVPASIGMTRIPTTQFMLWHALGAVAWALTITCLGYIAGQALETVLGHIRQYEFRIIFFVVLGILIFSLIGNLVRRILRKVSE